MAGGHVLDAGGERRADVRVVDGAIAEVASGLSPSAGAMVLDAEGCMVTPGLVDLQVHFREPGREENGVPVTTERIPHRINRAARGGRMMSTMTSGG